MLLGLLLLVVAIASSGGDSQETQCQSVYPSNYTFTRVHTENSNLSNCSSINRVHTECQHPSTLTDSIIGDGEGHEDYLVWKSDTFSRLLFTFSTEIRLQAITLYYCIDRGSGTSNPQLEFHAAPDDFQLGVTSPSNSTLLILSLTDRGSYLTVLFRPTMTRKLLVAKDLGSYRLGLSEVKFYTDCENFYPLTSGSIIGRYRVNGSEITCPILAVPTTTTTTGTLDTLSTAFSSTATPKTSTMIKTTLTTTSTTITDGKETPSPVVIAAAVMVVILVTAILIVIIVIGIVVCRKTLCSVKEKFPNLSRRMGQVESETSEVKQPDIEDRNVQWTDGVANTRCIENEYYDIRFYKQPSQKATPTESHDTPNDTYAVVNKTKKKKKMDSHLNDEGDSAPPPVPEHTTEMLYTAVQKKPKKKEELPTDDDDDDDHNGRF